jgi:hypothetical protein
VLHSILPQHEARNLCSDGGFASASAYIPASRPFRRAARVSTMLTAMFHVIFNRLIHLLGMIDARAVGSTIVQ